MNNKLKYSLLPIFILLAIGLVVYFVFIKNKSFGTEKEPEVRRLEGFPATVSATKDIEKQRLVLRSQDELNQFLNQIDESGALVVKENVDFNKDYVIAVSSKTYTEEGHGIKIRKIYDDNDHSKIIVSVKETELGTDCDMTANKNIVADLVLISKTDKEIDFERVKEVNECQ